MTATTVAESWASALLRAASAHSQFPLLHYFRPLDAQRSLLLQVGWLLSLARKRSLPGGSGDVALGPASVDLLFESVVGYLLVLNRGCVPGYFDPLRRDDVCLERLHARILRSLRDGRRRPCSRTRVTWSMSSWRAGARCGW